MWLLPMSLRAKMALAALLGSFFIPYAMADLRGLTHVLTCEDEVSASLFIENADADFPVLLSADSTTREDATVGLCGGLLVDLALGTIADGIADVIVTVTNDTDSDWQGTIELRFDGTPVPVAIGAIDAGETRSDTVELRVRAGADYEVEGTLLIGP